MYTVIIIRLITVKVLQKYFNGQQGGNYYTWSLDEK